MNKSNINTGTLLSNNSLPILVLTELSNCDEISVDNLYKKMLNDKLIENVNYQSIKSAIFKLKKQGKVEITDKKGVYKIVESWRKYTIRNGKR